jgi:nondiscriminating aspartyl-tRNA synthetase
MERTLIKDLAQNIEKGVTINGWIHIRRDHGKLIFLDIRDSTGLVQGVVLPNQEEAHKVAETLRPEWVVTIEGKVNKRPLKMVKEGVQNGDIELEITSITVLASAEVPFELDTELNIDTFLDNQPYTLRSERSRAIFKVQSHIIKAFHAFLDSRGFTEFQCPKIVGGDAEGGSAVYNIDHFGHKAGLATSPQLYKQIMVGVFERVYTIGNVFRAEKHATSRHLNEYTSLDLEFGFIKDHTDIMRLENDLMIAITEELHKTCEKEFALLKAEIPVVPAHIPTMKLREAQELIEKEFGGKAVGEPDLEPEHERQLCEWAKKTHNSDFIFITHYPITKRPFYTYEDENDKGFSKSFDLLFRGVEITTGGQRRHTRELMLEGLKNKNLNPELFSFYLQAFDTGMPPHGGLAIGLERLTQKFLNLSNVKEATLFPRDINRIDTLLSK